jgi:gliding motility-associated-like protein
MKTVRPFLLALMVMVGLFSGNLSAQVLTADSLALVALYNATNGANWTNRTNWLSGRVNTWYGITVNRGRVVQINMNPTNPPFSGNNLVGTLPTQLGSLTELTSLDLAYNKIIGTIPSQLGNLSKLVFLNLSNLQLTGSIPPELGNLNSLLVLLLNNNQLSGTIPTQLGNLSLVNQINLTFNQLTGTIPSALGSLPNLAELLLDNNQLTGTIPAELGNLSNLTKLSASENQLAGSIPTQLGNLTNLIELNLSLNQLSGVLPSQLGNLTNLLFLRLSRNGFNGTVPATFGNLTKLQELQLDSNQLNGDLPVVMANISTLVNLQLQNNNFTGLPALPKATLRRLNVANNFLTFEDLEPNIGIQFFTYAPQKLVPPGQTQTVTIGNPFSRSFSIGGTANLYQWRKNAVNVTGANTNTITIPSVAFADAGTFELFVTNSLVPGLTLQTEPTILNVIGIPATGVTVSPTSLSLIVGGANGILTATVLPSDASNKSVTWSSANPAIASVTNGVVTPLSGGTTTITVRTVDGGFTATSAVTVTVPVTGITVTPGTLTLIAGGGTGLLTANVLPSNATNKSVNWAATNPAIATVINGVVTPIAPGTVTITATTVEGGFSSSAIVSVVVPVTGITVSPTSLTLASGGAPATITASVQPANATNKTVNWTSSNTAVATVNNGIVTPLAVGTTTITARTADGGFTASSTVNVVIPVTGITISPSTLSLIFGSGTGQLTATVAPANATNKSVTWSSANSSVVTVTNGIVTPVSPGSTLITATTVEGGFTASAVVNIIVPATGITLSPPALTLAAGGATGTLTASVMPANATNKNVIWSSSNNGVASVANGVVTPLAMGDCIITATTQDGGFSANATITVTGMPMIGTKSNGVNQPNGSTVTFGTTEIGTERNRTIEVFNSGTAPLEIINILVTGDFSLASAIPTRINENTSESLTIRFSPTALGERRGTLTFLSNGNIPLYTLNLAGEGNAELEIFNVVSTNPNGKHDFLNIRNIWLYPNNRIQIFDRWGNPVYDQEGYDNDSRRFTGMSDKGKELPEGTYYYVLNKDKASQPLTGYIFLRRN